MVDLPGESDAQRRDREYRWTGVLVDDNVAFCGAGVFPYEGIYLCALDATDGSVIWKNDTIGDQAHEIDYGGISPQGYLVASKDVLYFPSSRAMRAGFDRSTGKFLFFASPGGKRGGAWALLDNLKLELVPQNGNPRKQHAPIISFLEIIEESGS